MERFSFASSSQTTPTTSSSLGFNLQEDPFAIELERLDALDLTKADILMDKVIDFKKSLFEDAKMMRKLLSLDQLSNISDTEYLQKKNMMKKSMKKKATQIVKKHNIDDDDDDFTETVPEDDENKSGEEATDEEEEEEAVIDDMEEENDYMESYFDNGEDYVE